MGRPPLEDPWSDEEPTQRLRPASRSAVLATVALTVLFLALIVFAIVALVRGLAPFISYFSGNGSGD